MELVKAAIRSYTLTISSYLQMVQSGEITLDAPYQRHFVWPLERQRSYITSIFLGYSQLGQFVVGSTRQHRYIIDGMNRTYTLLRFVEGKFSVKLGSVYKSWRDLSPDERATFLNSIISLAEVFTNDIKDLVTIFRIINVNQVRLSFGDLVFSLRAYDPKYAEIWRLVEALSKYFCRTSTDGRYVCRPDPKPVALLMLYWYLTKVPISISAVSRAVRYIDRLEPNLVAKAVKDLLPYVDKIVGISGGRYAYIRDAFYRVVFGRELPQQIKYDSKLLTAYMFSGGQIDDPEAVIEAMITATLTSCITPQCSIRTRAIIRRLTELFGGSERMWSSFIKHIIEKKFKNCSPRPGGYICRK